MSGFYKTEIRSSVELLASEHVLIGTSSWKYPGWWGQIYDERRYTTRNKFSKKRFEETCLAEYAEVFKTVCVDAGYYKFPDERYLEQLAAQVPADFKFAFKVTDEITIKKFPNLPRFGERAGRVNDNFLNPDLFTRAFLKPCESIKDNVGLLMFEFSQFHKADYEHGREFVAALDAFLSMLPSGWQYGVEIRNTHFLEPEYFEMLARHEVAHVYNSWSRMPPVSEQMAMERSQTTNFVAARFLLTPGQVYNKAVKDFSPYNETKAVDEDARTAGKTLIKKARQMSARPSYIFVNNRLEGNAMNTIMAMLGMKPTPHPSSKKTTVAPALTYPSYWIARVSLDAVDNHFPLVIFEAVYEVTESTGRATYTKEAALFDIGGEEEIKQHCVYIVKKAAFEFADARYGVNKLDHAYDYVLAEVQPITGFGLELEQPVFTSTSGVRVWLQEEHYPEE